MLNKLEDVLKEYFRLTSDKEYYLYTIDDKEITNDKSTLTRLVVKHNMKYYIQFGVHNMSPFQKFYCNKEESVNDPHYYLKDNYFNIISELKTKLLILNKNI